MKPTVYLFTILLLISQAYAADVNSGLPNGQNINLGPIVIIRDPGTSGQEGTGTDGVKVTKPGEHVIPSPRLNQKIQSLGIASPDLSIELKSNLEILMADEELMNELSMDVNALAKEEILIDMALMMSGIEMNELNYND